MLSVQHGSAMEPHLGAFPGQYVFSPDGILTGGIATDILDHLFGVGHAHIETPLIQFKIGRCLSY